MEGHEMDDEIREVGRKCNYSLAWLLGAIFVAWAGIGFGVYYLIKLVRMLHG